MLIILSCGRSGTNLVLEMFTGFSYLQPSEYPEDKLLFKRNIEYPIKYLTKCDTLYIDSDDDFDRLMKRNPHAKIIWTIRHPYDWTISKFYRGRPMEKRGWGYADDATADGCIKDMSWMLYLYKNAVETVPDRILTVRMEDVLTDIRKEGKRMCNFLNINYELHMDVPFHRMRHIGKKERYGNKLDTSQINLYKNVDTIYDGYFSKTEGRMDELKQVWEFVTPMLKVFNYEEINS
jgi:hypothetical protein